MSAPRPVSAARRLVFVGLALVAAVGLPQAIAAQPPSAPWRTLSTAHFRVHYPAPAEAWAQRAAARLESVRERVIAEVGFAPGEIVEVVVRDPVADANGAAYPILGWPRLDLWTSPPEADSELGVYHDYTELLLVHETTHLVHLLRPSRNPAEHLLERLIPVGPIGARVPRWVVEGYATLIEGRLTAAGRPNSDLRASILRRWAEAGRLPSYQQLASDAHSYEGMSMAYLLGSAYLEWLEQRAGPGSLKKLWARLTARTRRTFFEAFDGVFDGSPNVLYARFCAELTWKAIEAEKRVASAGPPALREGVLFESLSWSTGAPAVSPDGQRIAVVVRSNTRPTELVVWPTVADTGAARLASERSDQVRVADPEDVPPLHPRPPPRQPLYRLVARDGIAPRMPRWMPDGKQLLLVRFEPDPSGVLHPDLFAWTPASGALRRLTRGGDLRDPDPAPDGRSAVAARDRFGTSQLVAVDLSTGAIRELTPPVVEQVYDRPRISPDGRRIAVARSGDGVWRLVVYDLDSSGQLGPGRELAAPPGATVASPAWTPDSRRLVATVGLAGFIDVWEFAVPSPLNLASPAEPIVAPRPLTRTVGAALAPAPTPDGHALFFLSLKPEGLDVRRIEVGAAGNLPPPAVPAGLAPAVRPAAPARVAPFVLGEVPRWSPEGVGRLELLPLLGATISPAGEAAELGVRAGDLLGRFDLLALGALSRDGLDHGGALAAAWRGWPVELSLHLFDVATDPGLQSGIRPSAQATGMSRTGAELAAGWSRVGDGTLLELEGRFLTERLAPESGSDVDRSSIRLGAKGALRRRFGIWRLRAAAAGSGEAGTTGGSSWQRWHAGLELGAHAKSAGVGVAWSRDGSEHVAQLVDHFALGGAASSLLPESVLAGRIVDPALPLGFALGTADEEQRADLVLPGLPVPLFYERHRLWGNPLGLPWIDVIGVEPTFSVAPLPLLRLPGFALRAGFARLLAGRLGESNRWWLTTLWRP